MRSLGAGISERDVQEGKGMTEALRHRGPDHTGYFNDGECFLGNTRLKIIDLSDRGNMPMSNDDGSVWITYNGEVTNFRELKEKFRLDEKYAFRSSTDTEVVLRLYEELGIGLLDHLSGMFAFAVYDKKAGKVFVVRDNFGIRPLFYMRKGDRLYFASEIKSFLDLSRFNGDIDYEAMYHYFSLIYLPGEHTPFTEIKELDGGHLLEADLRRNAVELKEYYSIVYRPDARMTEKEAADGFYRVMLDSMDRNMISDAPLGITLSGGIDTSSMLAMAKELGKSSQVHTFSIRMMESSFDESYFQKIMVDHARPIHHQIDVGPRDVLENIITQMAYLDEPSGNGAIIPSYLLAKEARKYVSVLLSGEGGDEISNAYDTHLAHRIRGLYLRYVPAPARRLVYGAAHALPVSLRKLSLDFLAKRFTEGVEMEAPKAHLYWRHVFTEEEKKLLLAEPYSDYPPTDRMFTDLYDSLDFKDSLDRISLLDLKYFFICDLMVKNDRTFMANSVEARFPYVDRKVVDFVTTVPSKYRIKGFTPRYFEKKAMKNILPRQIFRRKSMGLEMPHSLWFFQGLEKLAAEYFTEERVSRPGIFNYAYIERLWREHRQRKRDNGRALWAVLNYLIWFDLFVHNRDYKRYLSPRG